jgi:DNA modification methylase
MKEIGSGSVNLTITSPPYDNLRSYNGNNDQWGEHVWREVIKQLYRVTKKGGVVVWVVGDATVKGSETGTSFKQALWAKECGFNLHDTMIYHKNALPKNHNRYEQDFEYMFVFSKGRPNTFSPIRIPTKYPEKETARKNSFYSTTNEKIEALEVERKESQSEKTR